MKKAVVVLFLAGLLAHTAAADDCDVSSYSASSCEDGTIRNVILENIRSAKEIITIGIRDLADDFLADALISAYQSGIYVEIIANSTRAAGIDSDLQRLVDEGIIVFLDASGHAVDHTFMVVDWKTVVTGSYNWIADAHEIDSESIAVIRCYDVAFRYSARFDALLMQYAFSLVMPGT
jgi:phosphatidylserine/phosphatidylglycerophosphate/cardiolipin synthase-like enzyme